jgi:hypothetical protein
LSLISKAFTKVEKTVRQGLCTPRPFYGICWNFSEQRFQKVPYLSYIASQLFPSSPIISYSFPHPPTSGPRYRHNTTSAATWCKTANAYGHMEHIQNLEKFAQEPSTIVNKQLPSCGKPDGQASVLASQRENDGIGVAPLEVKFLDIFWNILGSSIESFTIPATSTAGHGLTRKLGERS